MMKKVIWISIFVYFQGILLWGQNLQGTITDQAGSPIVNAYIILNRGPIHTHTNELGQFQIKDPKQGDTLTFNSLGFAEQRLVLGSLHFEAPIEMVLKERYFDLSQVTISKNVQAANQIVDLDLRTHPVNSSQEILQKVPGLFIAQHAGGGKAEQIFLRGFDIDHGTDINISVDGMPVNMVSHAHGQGYADLHFVIPETIKRIDFGKGPYYVEKGNFTTAGYVAFQTKEKLDHSLLSVELGAFHTFRTLGMFDLLSGIEGQDAYLATEFMLTDGPFESPQHFNRANMLGRYTTTFSNNDRLSIMASHFQSKWDASGQIPQRAVNEGQISRFGAIDDTEGGKTRRTNIGLQHTHIIDRHTFLKSNAYYNHYAFELFSNFTFFLNDPDNGDQIRQYENRQIVGMQSALFHEFIWGRMDGEVEAGVGLRYDQIAENTLSKTLNRKTLLEQIALGDVNESNLFGFVGASFDFGKFRLNPGLRLDYFKFEYIDELQEKYQTLSNDQTVVSPKMNLIYKPSNQFQYYLKSGLGFHSNDTRVVVSSESKAILPTAFGTDVGMIWKPYPRWWLNLAGWYLSLEQELVYVGDAGIVEPSGKTRRLGGDFGWRYQINDYFFFDGDINYTFARSVNEPEQANRIPLAPDLTASGGLAFQLPMGLSGGLRSRFIKNRPANEDGSIIAEGYFITDFNLNYDLKSVTIGFSIDNLFDVDWNEAQFATESRLQQELEPVEELHFTPGTPFYINGKLTYRF